MSPGVRPSIWTILAATTGSMMGLFLAIPPICFGVAAFNPTRAAEITATIHELGLLTLVTTDQIYIFCWTALVVTCLAPGSAPHSPFHRWYGYFSIFCGIAFEAGAFAFNFEPGPLSWNGLLPFWIPCSLAGLWIPLTGFLLIKALKAQQRAGVERREPVPA